MGSDMELGFGQKLGMAYIMKFVSPCNICMLIFSPNLLSHPHAHSQSYAKTNV